MGGASPGMLLRKVRHQGYEMNARSRKDKALRNFLMSKRDGWGGYHSKGIALSRAERVR